MISAVGTLTVSYVMDWSLLRLTVVLLDRRPRLWRLALASAVGSLPTLWVLLTQNFYAVPWEVLMLWPFSMLLLTLGRLSWRVWIKAYFVFLALTILAGGIALVVLTWIPRLSLPSWLLIGTTVPAVLWAIGHFLPRQRIRQYLGESPYGEVRLILANKSLTVRCLWDSGNRMRDPVLRRPVIILEVNQAIEWLPSSILAWVSSFLAGKPSPVPEEWKGRLGSVRYQSIGGEGMLPVVALDRGQGRFQDKWYSLAPVTLALTNVDISADRSYFSLVSPDCIISINHEGVGA
ncbi:MAG: sigma-E processing peptidase SpoIIGA [Firmicutes bacterium]|nr:sigma-E processing peptidase SpoIIGA [Bacillota bacterium]